MATVSKTQLLSDIATYINSGVPGAVSAQDVRERMVDMVDSLEVAQTQSTLTYAGTVNLDFSGASVQLLSITGDVTFTTSNLAVAKGVCLIVTCDSTQRNLTFPAGWTWLGTGTAPASIAAGKVGELVLYSRSTDNANVVAGWAEQSASSSGGMSNPMTTSGDIIVGGASGAPARLAVGSTGQVLSVVSGAPAWAAASGGGSVQTFDASFDGQGNTLTDATLYRPVMTSGTLTAAACVADVAGTATVSVAKHTPTGGSLGSSTALGTLSLTAAQYAVSSPSWAVSAGDVLSISIGGTLSTLTKLFVRLA